MMLMMMMIMMIVDLIAKLVELSRLKEDSFVKDLFSLILDLLSKIFSITYTRKLLCSSCTDSL